MVKNLVKQTGEVFKIPTGIGVETVKVTQRKDSTNFQTRRKKCRSE